MPPPEAQQPARLIAAFEGSVRVAAPAAAISFSLIGRERGTGVALEVHFSGAGSRPASVADHLEVWQLDAARWRLLAKDRADEVAARAVQVHRMPAAAFAGAVPGASLTLATRLGWALLLYLLRIPGAVRVLGWLRSSRA